MASDPAFLFYPSDFVEGTIDLTLEEIGGYMKVLCAQHSKGKLSEHKIKKILGEKFDKIWPEIKDKFKFSNGLYYNERLEQEKKKRSKYVESRKRNLKGKKKNKTHKGTHTKPHMDTHMVNVNVNVNEDVNRDENVSEKTSKKEKLIYPFETENFKKHWHAWIEYKRKQHKFSFKDQKYEQQALKKLSEISGHSEKTACNIIEQSIANGWKGLFELKENGKRQTDTTGFEVLQNYLNG